MTDNYEFEDTPTGTLVIRPRADVALPPDPDMEVVLGLMRDETLRAEQTGRRPFDWWRWWNNVREAMRTGDIETLDAELQLGLKKGFA